MRDGNQGSAKANCQETETQMKDMQDTQVSIPDDSQQLLMLSDKVLGNGELLDDDDNEEEDEEGSKATGLS